MKEKSEAFKYEKSRLKGSTRRFNVLIVVLHSRSESWVCPIPTGPPVEQHGRGSIGMEAYYPKTGSCVPF